MTYGVTINGVNTKSQYGLILAELDIEAPAVNSVYVTVPGHNGSYDFTDVLNGGPTFADRNITFTLFKRVTDPELMALRNQLANNYSGKSVSVIFPSDPDHYYVGRLTVGKIGPSYNSGKISFSMVAKPALEDV